MKENLVIKWLKEYFDKPNLNEKDLKPLLHFLLLWNLFEHNYFTDDRHLNTERLLTLSEQSYELLSDECINTTFNFFKKRYIQNNKSNNLLKI